jgi:2-dehydro-3-deoxygluconokinase
VLIKLGADGCFALAHGEAMRVAAIPVAAVDTVGAGDAFAAGYLAEFLAGGDLGSRLHTAVCAGAFACLGVGDWESLPQRRDLALLTPGDPVTR